jgi:hypothetical protein
MKAIISDFDILKHLQPQQVEDYLQTKGWHQHSRVFNKVSIWIRETYSEDKLKIQLPVDQSFDDYPLRIYEIMETLEKAENRSQVDILGELLTAFPNITLQGIVIQINTPNADKLSGEIIILGVVFDKLRRITTELADHEYIIAIKAYQERLPIICTGDLVEENNSFILKNPISFKIDNI